MKIKVIAQNFEIYDGDGLDKFARTGEISANHIFRAGAQGVVLGHSEVRDSPAVINKKLLSLVKNNKSDLSSNNNLVILVGENWSEYENNTPKKIARLMKTKCDIIFKNIPEQFLKNLIIGYEPKWGSRGSGRDDMPPPQPKFISECIKKMKLFIREKYSSKLSPYFIYGGRSTPERTKQILADRLSYHHSLTGGKTNLEKMRGGVSEHFDKNINGLILGSACNTIKKTLDIANTMKNVCKDRTKVLICNFKAYDLPDSYEEYISKLSKLPEDFLVFLAPPYTDIRVVRILLEEKNL